MNKAFQLPQHQQRALAMLVEISEWHAARSGHGVDAAYVSSALGCLAAFIGPEKLASAYGEVPPVSNREDHLSLLADRLEIAMPLFESVDPKNSHGSLWAAARELRALANGDIPQLFERLPVDSNRSEKRTAYRLAEFQLRALAWEAFFKARGDKPGFYQARISAAFAGLTWDAIRKWKSVVTERLGSETVELHLEIARVQGKLGHRGDEGKINSALARDGAAYVQMHKIGGG